MRTKVLVYTVTVCALAAAFSFAVPEAPPKARTWQLDVSFHDPQRIEVRLPGDEEPTTYWYMLYTVTNETGRDVRFYPSASLVTDTLEVVRAGDDVPPQVYEAIGARHKKEYPFFAPPTAVTGPLLQGEDRARTTAAVFSTFDPEADAFTVYVTGLSGDVRRVPNPAFDRNQPESEENPRAFLLRRTLAIEYKRPGEPDTRHLATPVRRDRQWVMR